MTGTVVNWGIICDVQPDGANNLANFATGFISLRDLAKELRGNSRIRKQARSQVYNAERIGNVNYARKLARRALRRRNMFV